MTTPPPMLRPDEIDPLNPDKKRELTPGQELAEFPEYQKRHPELAAQRRAQFDPDQLTAGHALGQWLRPGAQATANTLSPMFDHGAAVGGIGAGALGFGAGFLADKLTQTLFDTDMGLSWKLGLLGAGAGGVIGHHRKQAAGLDQLALLIKQDPTLSAYERAMILQYLRAQPAAERQRLTHLAMQAGGAGIGALIARQMMGGGVMSMLLGGFAGSQMGDYFATDRNSSGQPIRPANL